MTNITSGIELSKRNFFEAGCKSTEDGCRTMVVRDLKIQSGYNSKLIVLMADSRRRFRYGSTVEELKLNLRNFDPLEPATFTARAVGRDRTEEVSI